MKDEKLTEGVTCLSCGSVIFGISKLIDHVVEYGHNYFKFGEGNGVVFIKVLLDRKNAYRFWNDENE